VFTFRDGKFPNPDALVQWINDQGSRAKIRPDMKLVIIRNWETPEDRLNGTRQLMQTLVKLADVT
jgi:transcription-repair coupling factor (superfamily II helicase)